MQQRPKVLRSLSIRGRARQISSFPDVAKKGTLSKLEGESGAILEASFDGLKLGPSKSLDGDYIIQSGVGRLSTGKTIDQFGVPQRAIEVGGFKMSDFLLSVDDHFRKTSDFLLMDIRSLDAQQKTAIKSYINDNYSGQLDRLITIE